MLYHFKHVDKVIDLQNITAVEKYVNSYDRANVKHYLKLTFNNNNTSLVYLGSDDTYYSNETRCRELLDEEYKLIVKGINESAESKSELELFRQWFDCVHDTSPQHLKIADFKLAKKVYNKLGLRVPSSIKSQLT